MNLKKATYETPNGPKEVEYDADAPCWSCGLPVGEASMAGTVVCPACDMGRHRDGTIWSARDVREFGARFIENRDKAEALLTKKNRSIDDPWEANSWDGIVTATKEFTLDPTKWHLGMTRAEVIAAFGAPHDYNRGTRKYPNPMVFKYGNIEFHFNSHNNDGRLFLIQEVDGHGNKRMIARY